MGLACISWGTPDCRLVRPFFLPYSVKFCVYHTTTSCVWQATAIVTVVTTSCDSLQPRMNRGLEPCHRSHGKKIQDTDVTNHCNKPRTRINKGFDGMLQKSGVILAQTSRREGDQPDHSDHHPPLLHRSKSLPTIARHHRALT